MNSHSEDWKSKSEKDLDLELENQALELNIKLRGGKEIIRNENLDPRLHNTFLKNIEAYEELDKEPKRTIKSLFPEDFSFPDVTTIATQDLNDLLDDIYCILNQNNVEISLVGKLPERLIYQYLIKEVIPNEVTYAMQYDGFVHIIDGCDGYCPECFQKDYCKTSEEIDWDDPIC